jgi:hypothetical protein
MFPYIYLAKWWDDCAEQVSYGLTFGQNYPDAITRVVEYFGEENIIEITLTETGDGSRNVLELSQELAESIKNFSPY